MFNWSTTDPGFPKLTDLVNNSTVPSVDMLRIFTYVWTWFLGGWFFAMFFGAVAAALYIKYNNATVPMVFLLLIGILFAGVFNATPVGVMSAEFFIFLIVILSAFVVGFILYSFFIGRKG